MDKKRKDGHMCNGTVLVVGGTGEVGRYVVEYLARSQYVQKLVVAARTEEVGKMIVKNAAIGAAMHGFYPKVDFFKLDLKDEEQTEKALVEIEPQVILHTATLMSSYYYVSKIKPKIKEFGFKTYFAGHTLAKDLFLIYKLMKALKRSGVNSLVVNNAFPDISNHVLAKIGLAPAVGSGTIDLTVYGIKKILADKIGVPMHNFFVEMIAHHSLRVNSPEDVPYFLRIRFKGEDITEKFNVHELVAEACKLTIGTSRVNNSSITASSATKNVLAILNPTKELEHAPGANGMLGGSPVRFHAKKVEVAPPEGMSLRDVEKINKEGLKFDGIERINDDGSVIFTNEAVRLQQILKISWKRMRINEIEDMANDLISAYRRL